MECFNHDEQYLMIWLLKNHVGLFQLERELLHLYLPEFFPLCYYFVFQVEQQDQLANFNSQLNHIFQDITSSTKSLN